MILNLSEDVLKSISTHKKRPKLVVGFSAETENLLRNSKKKFQIKKCDWMIANKITKTMDLNQKKIKFFLLKKIILRNGKL